jgi:hypothetical protein
LLGEELLSASGLELAVLRLKPSRNILIERRSVISV